MAGLVAAARARELGARRDACSRRATARAARCCSRAGSSGATWTSTSSAGSARRRPGAAAARLGAPRRRTRLARAARRARHRRATRENPLTTGRRFDTRGLTDALVRAAGKFGSAAGAPRDGRRRSSSPPAASRATAISLPAHRGPAGRSRCGRTRGARATGFGSASPAGRRAVGAEWTSSTAATCPRASGGPRSSCRSRSSTAARAGARRATARPFFPGEVSWSENDLVAGDRRAGRARRAWYVLDAAGARRPCGRSSRRPAPRCRHGARLPGAGAARSWPSTSGVDHPHDRRPEGRRARPGPRRRRALGRRRRRRRVSTGGYASGLAQALVLGLAAAEDAADAVTQVTSLESADQALGGTPD